MKLYLLIVLSITATLTASAQNQDKIIIDQIYKDALTTSFAYENLHELCTKAPGRLVGSKASETAIQLLKRQLTKINPDTIYLQPYKTTTWRCKTPAKALVLYRGKKESLNVVNLGLSVSSPANGVEGELLEVHSLQQLDTLGTTGVKGKIVFFNRPMDNSELNTFEAYGNAVDQRSLGAVTASKYGAAGAIVRSMATEKDDFPHTGVSRYKTGAKDIPNLAISTNDAEKLSKIAKENKGTAVWIKSDTELRDSVPTANLIAEIKGSIHPEKVILIGAHMDAWFNTPGAHDDGTGCAQMIDVIRIFKQLNIKPQNTIRLVLFMDEEMLQSGSKAYSAFAGREKKEHIACLESDAGGALPLGFEIDAPDSVVAAVKNLAKPLFDNGVYLTVKGYGGVDINPLKKYGFPLIGLLTNSQRYFEFHHSANDTVDKVSRREMQLGTASIASLVYLIDKYGL